MIISGSIEQLKVLKLYAEMHGWEFRESEDWYQVLHGSKRNFVLRFINAHLVKTTGVQCPALFKFSYLMNKHGTMDCTIDKEKIYKFVRENKK